jgi:hypothetical protein
MAGETGTGGGRRRIHAADATADIGGTAGGDTIAIGFVSRGVTGFA